ncbi:MAG: hypothetical protein GWN29_03605 [Gammaproteobacteria bacterium]|nr:hypothetical protein [Gammaproteobacteria bacterium]
MRIRDGEPVDADVRAVVDRDPELRDELAGLAGTQRALQDLPAFEPPPGVYERIRGEIAAQQSRSRRPTWQWPLRGAIAASVAVAAVWLAGRLPETPIEDTAAPATIVAEETPAPQVTPLLGTPSYASLVEESARLERALDEIQYRPRVVRASTAATIDGLEDRIALIDEQLMFARALGLSTADRRVLYRQRVELMNALVQIRYAEARRFAF